MVCLYILLNVVSLQWLTERLSIADRYVPNDHIQVAVTTTDGQLRKKYPTGFRSVWQNANKLPANGHFAKQQYA